MGIDLTPGFNITKGNSAGAAPSWLSVGGIGIGATQHPAATNTSSNSNTTARSSVSTPAPATASAPLTSAAASATAPTNDPQAVAYYNDLINQTNSQVGNLDAQQQQLLANANNSYDSSLKGLNDQQAVAQRNYETAKQSTINDNVTAKQGIDESVRNNTNALQRLLGLAGSGNSSAADYANYVAARQGTLQRQGVQSAYGKNMQGLDTSFGDTQNQYQNQLASLADQKLKNENGILSGVSNNRASLLQTLANLKIQAGQAGGQNYTTAAASASPYVQQIQALQAAQAGLSKDYANPVYNTQGVAFAAPTLDSYNTEGAAIQPGTQGINDTVSPIYANLLKKDANGNVLAG